MSKAISILEVLEKAHAGKSMSAKRRKLIADSYGRALVMRKILDDFIKVNRQLLIDMGIEQNANLLHGDNYTLNVTQKHSVKLDNKLIKEALGELEYHKCKVPTQYWNIQAMPITQEKVSKEKENMSIGTVVDFKLAV